MNKAIFYLLLLFGFSLHAQDDLKRTLKAEHLLKENKAEEAIVFLDSIKTKDYYVTYLLGEASIKQEDYQKAIAYYKKSNSLQANYANYALVKAYTLAQSFDSAVVYLKKYLRIKPKVFLSTIQEDEKLDMLKSSEHWKKLQIDKYYSKEESAIQQAFYYKSKSEISLALDILDELIINDKHYLEAYYYRAQFILILNNDYKYAIDDLKKTIKSDPQNYKYNLLLADYYFHEMKYKKALKHYLIVNQVFPYEIRNYAKLGASYYRTGDHENAISYINQYLEIVKKDADVYKLAGQVYYDKTDFTQAINFLTLALSHESRRVDILVARGKAYLENEEYQRAGMDFNIALDLDSKNGEIWYLKGLAFLYQEKKDEACKYFKKASYLNYYKADEYLLQECK